MARRFLGVLLAVEATYLVGTMVVVVPFASAMDSFEDGRRNPLAYAGVWAGLGVSVAIVATAVLATQKRWVERADRATAARAVVGIAAVVNFVGSLVAVAMITTGEPLFWTLAAAYAFATGLGCAWHRRSTVTA